MPLIPIILLFCLIMGIAYLVYIKRKERELIEQVTPITRGEWSERRVVLYLLKEGINPKAIFHDLYIQKPNGEYTQIDIAVATKAGLIVFEVKDYSGWIFGNEHQKYWTQLLAYGKEKYRFYNPIMQNARHIQSIRQCLPQNPGIPIYSVIVFFGNSEFKDVTCNADNTFLIYPRSIRQVVSAILMQPDANFGNKYEIMNLFTEAVQNGNDPMIPEERDKGAENCQLPNGDSVAIYQLVPVYTEEVLFKQANGIIPLLDKMKNVSYIVDTHRENTCRNFSAFEENGDSSISMDEKANASLRSILTIRKGNMATPLLVYINIALFVIMSICGVSLLAPTGISIIKWGADFGPLTLTGDWWRTITCNFIHIGVIHVLMNMYALLYIGIFLEQLIGGRRLISAYFLTGLFSALASLAMHPESISAGASGSIFGLYGIFLSYLVFHHRIEKGQRKSLLYSIGFFVFYNLMSGARAEGIDNAAHIGGLVSGIILGIIYLLTDRFATKKTSTLFISITEISFVLIFTVLFAGQTSNLPADFIEIREMWENGTLEEYAQSVSSEKDTIETDPNTSYYMPQNTTDVSTFTGSETDLGNGMKEYINNSCGFSCQYPSTWETIGKSDTEQILQLRGHGVSSLTVSYIKAPSKGAMEHMYDLLINSMKESRSENINIHGKTFERISGKMECAVAGGGSIHINQNIVIHMNEETLENFIITSTTSDDSSESEVQEIIKTIRIN